MPDRVVKESIGTSDSLSKVSLLASLFWANFLTVMDDYGCFDARPAIIRAKVFPLRSDVTSEMIEGWIQEFASVGLIIFDTFGRGFVVEYYEYLPELYVETFTDWMVLRQEIFRRDGYRCTYCGAMDLPLECDHIIPRSRGGTDEKTNLTTACKPCNRSKRAKLVSEWRGR